MRYIDRCEHGPECYVGTIEHVSSPRSDVKHYDVYVYGDSEVCLRYGSEGSEYLSPGPLYSFIQSAARSDRYRKALDLLLTKGRITWNPTNQGEPS